MKVGILGLGLIGGSLARAYALEGHTVYAQESDEQILSFAILSGAVHAPLDEELIAQCELILLAIYPDGSASWLENHAPQISPSALVLDCCGIKREVCARCFPLAEKYGFTFVGGHPMAGTQFSGFKYSRATLFRGAPMVLVPPVFDDISLLLSNKLRHLNQLTGLVRQDGGYRENTISLNQTKLYHRRHGNNIHISAA